MDEASIIVPRMDVRSLIAQWPTRKALASEIGMKTDAVHKWAQNQSIPARHHLKVIRAAQRRGIEIDAHALAEMHASDDAA